MSGGPMRWTRSKGPSRDTALLASPQSLEAERAVLGSMLLLGGTTADPAAIATLEEIVSQLPAEAFYSLDHARLYALLAARIREGHPMDVLGLADHLMLTGAATTVGGLAYSSSLPEYVPTTENVLYYVGIILDKHKRRKLLEHAARIREMVFEGEDADAIAERVAVEAETLRDAGVQAASDDLPIASVADRFFVDMYDQKIAIREGRATGLPFGFHALDKIGCPGPGELAYFAARPAMGKTQLMMQVLVHHAEFIAEHRLPGVIYLCSLEMDGHQLMARLLSKISGVAYSKMLNARAAMNDDEIARVDRAREQIRRLPVIINDRPARNMASVRRSVRALARRYGAVHSIGLDYIQLASPEDDAGELRSQQLTQTAYAALEIAREFRSRFFCAVQLNRTPEGRQDKRPQLSDLGESGGLEQAAQWVFMLYRDEYYRPDSPDRGVAEVICRKARNGETQTGRLGFGHGVFVELDAESPHKYGGYY